MTTTMTTIHRPGKDAVCFAVDNGDGTVNVHVLRPERVSWLGVPLRVRGMVRVPVKTNETKEAVWTAKKQ